MTIEAVGTLETELRRQSAVEALEILDTAPEDRFDRITRMAQQLFGVPMVSITLLDTTASGASRTSGSPVRLRAPTRSATSPCGPTRP